MIKKILIANRSEISIRISRAATELGFKVIQQRGKGLGDAYRHGVEIASSNNI